jgi:hypothetical protein
MAPKQEAFLLDIRRAAGLFQKPTVLTSDSELASGETFGKLLRHAHTWLTSKTVAAYEPSLFVGFPQDQQDALERAVGHFRHIAESVPAGEAASNQQYENGRAAFAQLVSVVGRMVREEWRHAVEKVMLDLQEWCKSADWRTRRVEKQLDETLLGKYSLAQLMIYADQNLYVADPLARFVPGAKGSIDLSIQPSFYITTLYRDYTDGWIIQLDVGQGVKSEKQVPLTKETFVDALNELLALL